MDQLLPPKKVKTEITLREDPLITFNKLYRQHLSEDEKEDASNPIQEISYDKWPHNVLLLISPSKSEGEKFKLQAFDRKKNAILGNNKITREELFTLHDSKALHKYPVFFSPELDVVSQAYFNRQSACEVLGNQAFVLYKRLSPLTFSDTKMVANDVINSIPKVEESPKVLVKVSGLNLTTRIYAQNIDDFGMEMKRQVGQKLEPHEYTDLGVTQKKSELQELQKNTDLGETNTKTDLKKLEKNSDLGETHTKTDIKEPQKNTDLEEIHKETDLKKPQPMSPTKPTQEKRNPIENKMQKANMKTMKLNENKVQKDLKKPQKISPTEPAQDKRDQIVNKMQKANMSTMKHIEDKTYKDLKKPLKMSPTKPSQEKRDQILNKIQKPNMTTIKRIEYKTQKDLKKRQIITKDLEGKTKSVKKVDGSVNRTQTKILVCQKIVMKETSNEKNKSQPGRKELKKPKLKMQPIKNTKLERETFQIIPNLNCNKTVTDNKELLKGTTKEMQTNHKVIKTIEWKSVSGKIHTIFQNSNYVKEEASSQMNIGDDPVFQTSQIKCEKCMKKNKLTRLSNLQIKRFHHNLKGNKVEPKVLPKTKKAVIHKKGNEDECENLKFTQNLKAKGKPPSENYVEKSAVESESLTEILKVISDKFRTLHMVNNSQMRFQDKKSKTSDQYEIINHKNKLQNDRVEMSKKSKTAEASKSKNNKIKKLQNKTVCKNQLGKIVSSNQKSSPKLTTYKNEMVNNELYSETMIQKEKSCETDQEAKKVDVDKPKTTCRNLKVAKKNCLKSQTKRVPELKSSKPVSLQAVGNNNNEQTKKLKESKLKSRKPQVIRSIIPKCKAKSDDKSKHISGATSCSKTKNTIPLRNVKVQDKYNIKRDKAKCHQQQLEKNTEVKIISKNAKDKETNFKTNTDITAPYTCIKHIRFTIKEKLDLQSSAKDTIHRNRDIVPKICNDEFKLIRPAVEMLNSTICIQDEFRHRYCVTSSISSLLEKDSSEFEIVVKQLRPPDRIKIPSEVLKFCDVSLRPQFRENRYMPVPLPILFDKINFMETPSESLLFEFFRLADKHSFKIYVRPEIIFPGYRMKPRLRLECFLKNNRFVGSVALLPVQFDLFVMMFSKITAEHIEDAFQLTRLPKWLVKAMKRFFNVIHLPLIYDIMAELAYEIAQEPAAMSLDSP